MPRSTLFLVALSFTVVLVSVVFFLSQRRNDPKRAVQRFLNRLVPVDESLLRAIADSDGVSDDELRHARLPLLRQNCDVLILIAEQVQELHPEAFALTDDLRRIAQGMTWHLDRLKSANPHWQSNYGRTVVRCYLDAAEAFLAQTELFSGSLRAAAYDRLWGGFTAS